MVIPVLLILISFLFILMWAWIISIFAENMKIKKQIDELINQPLTVQQKEELDNLQLDLDTNAFRARNAKRVVLVFSFLYVIAALALIFVNTKYSLLTYDGLLATIKLTMLIVIIFFVPAYIGLELISNTQGASGDINSRLKFSHELKPGEEVEV
jgi:hypothetical protein